jgi:hypothetical protein
MKPQSPERTTTNDAVHSQPKPIVKNDTHDFFAFLAAAIDSRIFLCAVLAGFALCCFVGKLSSEKNVFRNFARFQLHMCLQTNFYPTVSELVALAEEKSRPDQILVIVGGSSVMHGVGQSEDVLWTKKLQELLGNKFCVVNFGLKSGSPFEGGYIAAEALSKRRKNVIYLADYLPGQIIDSATGPIYSYMYWDALSRNCLMPESRRTNLIDEKLAQLKPSERDRINDLKLRAQLDSYFHFTDLWNSVAVRYFSTIWYPYASNPFKARKSQTPEWYVLETVGKRFEKNFQTEIDINKSLGAALTKKDDAGNWVIDSAQNRMLQQQASSIAPEEMKKRMLLVSIPRCPITLKGFSSDELEKRKLGYETSCNIWKNSGFRASTVGQGLSPADYVDFVHLAPSGGTKLAQEVYPQIIKLCKEENML